VSDELRALLVSLETGSLAMVFMLPPGLALALYLARGPARLRSLVEAVVMLPLVLPPVAIGVFLLAVLGRGGLGFLSFVCTMRGAALAAALVALPIFVRVARAALEDVDPRLEGMAAVLGASPLRVAVTITLPLAIRGLLAAFTLAFARALGEFGATIVVAGAVRGETETLPIAIFQAFEHRGSATTLCLISAGLALALAIASARLSPRRSS
jgi:molybdate transport system permease protein